VAIQVESKWEHITFEWKNAVIIDVAPRAGRRMGDMGDLRSSMMTGDMLAAVM